MEFGALKYVSLSLSYLPSERGKEEKGKKNQSLKSKSKFLPPDTHSTTTTSTSTKGSFKWRVHTIVGYPVNYRDRGVRQTIPTAHC